MVMQSEVSLMTIYNGMPHWTESIEMYERAGLHVAGMFPVTRDATGRIIEYDCLLVRSAAPAVALSPPTSRAFERGDAFRRRFVRLV